MQRLKDLPLAGRLGLGFGTLALALIVVAAFAGTRMGALGDNLRTLDERDLAATELAGQVGTRASAIGRLVVQHLYVYDGDLKTEDKIAAEIVKLRDANAGAAKHLAELTAGTPVEAATAEFAKARETFAASYAEVSRDISEQRKVPSPRVDAHARDDTHGGRQSEEANPTDENDAYHNVVAARRSERSEPGSSGAFARGRKLHRLLRHNLRPSSVHGGWRG